MQEKRTYVLEGVICSESPLAVCSAALKDTVGKDAPTPVPVNVHGQPYLPATTIRGSLRRACAEVLRQALGIKLSLDEYFLAVIGGVKGAGEESKTSVALEKEWREKNPLLSLFGAGDAGVLGFVGGHLSMGNAVAPVGIKPEHFSGVRSDDLYRNPEGLEKLNDEEVKKLVAQALASRDRSKTKAKIDHLKALVKSAKKAKQDTAELDAEIASLEDSLDGGVAVGMPLVGYLAIPENVEMKHRMVLIQATELELSLLLAGLNFLMVNDPFIGAHRATGCGLISGEWSLKVSGENEPLATIVATPFVGVTGYDFSGIFEFAKSGNLDLSVPA